MAPNYRSHSVASAGARTLDDGMILSEPTVYIDFLCPWAYRGAMWLADVEKAGRIRPHFRFFSLSQNHDARQGSSEPMSRARDRAGHSAAVSARCATSAPQMDRIASARYTSGCSATGTAPAAVSGARTLGSACGSPGAPAPGATSRRFQRGRRYT